jgi:hypothetical protein
LPYRPVECSNHGNCIESDNRFQCNWFKYCRLCQEDWMRARIKEIVLFSWSNLFLHSNWISNQKWEITIRMFLLYIHQICIRIDSILSKLLFISAFYPLL